MRFRKDAMALVLSLFAGVVFGQSAPPGLWMYTDEYGQPGYSGVELVDTSSFGPPYTINIGLNNQPEIRDDAYDTTESIMYYFSFNYQFTNGWSGFKMMWEDRDMQTPWDATGYDSLVIKYIGPLQSHKVDIFFGEAPDRYAPAFIDSIGSLPSNYSSTYKSSAWKTVSIPLPPAPSGADRTQIVEVRFIIHNKSGTTAVTSAAGNLSIDKVGLISAKTGIRAAVNRQSIKNNHTYFTSVEGGPIDLSLFSLSGKLLAHRHVSVSAGKQYAIKQFTFANLKVSASQVNVVRIIGAGLNVQEKIHN